MGVVCFIQIEFRRQSQRKPAPNHTNHHPEFSRHSRWVWGESNPSHPIPSRSTHTNLSSPPHHPPSPPQTLNPSLSRTNTFGPSMERLSPTSGWCSFQIPVIIDSVCIISHIPPSSHPVPSSHSFSYRASTNCVSIPNSLSHSLPHPSFLTLFFFLSRCRVKKCTTLFCLESCPTPTHQTSPSFPSSPHISHHRYWAL